MAHRERGKRVVKNSLLMLLQAVMSFLRWWLEILDTIRKMLRQKLSAPKPWQISIRPIQKVVKGRTADVQRLVQQHRDLQDMEKIAAMAVRFKTPESDYFGDPAQVERLISHLLEKNPPWLYVSQVLSGGEQGADSQAPETVIREQTVRTVEETTLYIPEDHWRDTPLANLTMRQTRHLEEVWQSRLLEQVLPPEVMVDRHSRGEILIPIRQKTRNRIEFRTEKRPMEVTVRRPVAVPIPTEGTGGKGGQLLYILLDYSASMQGMGATLAMAVIATVIRANMGQRETRYLFRRYADKEELWPRVVEPPVQARTVKEKDRFLDTILGTNFNGSATHINDALEVAVRDIEHLRKSEQLEASMLLVTDGRAEILESTVLRIRGAGVKVHTIMVSADPHPGLEHVSESFTNLNIHPELLMPEIPAPAAPLPTRPLPVRPRRAYHI